MSDVVILFNLNWLLAWMNRQSQKLLVWIQELNTSIRGPVSAVTVSRFVTCWLRVCREEGSPDSCRTICILQDWTYARSHLEDWPPPAPQTALRLYYTISAYTANTAESTTVFVSCTLSAVLHTLTEFNYFRCHWTLSFRLNSPTVKLQQFIYCGFHKHWITESKPVHRLTNTWRKLDLRFVFMFSLNCFIHTLHSSKCETHKLLNSCIVFITPVKSQLLPVKGNCPVVQMYDVLLYNRVSLHVWIKQWL